jgi:phospholipid/cholesterol/gamma-HCH transport system permease protein
MTTEDHLTTSLPATLTIKENAPHLLIIISGDWRLGANLPDNTQAIQQLNTNSALNTIQFDASALNNWDTSLISKLAGILLVAEQLNIQIDASGLPEGAQSLLKLAFAVKEREGARRTKKRPSWVAVAGQTTLDLWASGQELVAFVGELTLSIKRLVTGQAAYQRSHLWLAIQEAGAEALPIVGLISFLIGMIFAFVGVMQLQNFGAGIYTADLVAVAMVREMGPIMTAIIMAGRTGAAYAAQLGTMKVNEEIDALTTLGINPIDFLVLPKFFALILMMPFLTMYASLLGIIGGMIVAISMLDVSVIQYVMQTNASLGLNTLFGGLFKALVYGGLVALAGTQQGMACGDSAMAVGQATTKAVVTGIVLIVVSASIITVIFVNLGI